MATLTSYIQVDIGSPSQSNLARKKGIQIEKVKFSLYGGDIMPYTENSEN